jgi:hypothetical protein
VVGRAAEVVAVAAVGNSDPGMLHKVPTLAAETLDDDDLRRGPELRGSDIEEATPTDLNIPRQRALAQRWPVTGCPAGLRSHGPARPEQCSPPSSTHAVPTRPRSLPP